MEAGDLLYLTSRNSGNRYLGRYSGHYTVTLLATAYDSQTIDEIRESTKELNIDDFRYSMASQYLIESYYSKQDPKLLDFIVQGSVL